MVPEVRALSDVDLEVDEGEFVVVLGPSGSGKSTLLSIIGALDSPREGRAVVAGREIIGMSRRELFGFRREVVSFVFLAFNLFRTLTALENVQCGAEIGARAKEARRRATAVLGEVGLADRDGPARRLGCGVHRSGVGADGQCVCLPQHDQDGRRAGLAGQPAARLAVGAELAALVLFLGLPPLASLWSTGAVSRRAGGGVAGGAGRRAGGHLAQDPPPSRRRWWATRTSMKVPDAQD